ncbi:molybdenum cofactor biosynthesis protein MoaE [Williamsia maris]|uniref:Molybdopterin synthase catalytic subunit n=1 Tax=Williamsia maris TaxID=72806 RepID=A0ABT1HJF4_9NOCA|nr:molybdenum cofactor biosynthesis protein MoaE [Williamsia maris]MCP2178049.1 molybdopterin synthase catalytic subunit [Williamsia maris]
MISLGDASRVVCAVVTGEPLSVADLTALVRQPRFGAVFSFEGTVRDHDHNRVVMGLEYVAHPSASEVIARLTAESATAHPDCVIAVAHRTGRLAIGDAAFVAVVASAHRGAAFAGCFDVVEKVKAELPIWKVQQFADGSTEWVNCA